MKQGEVEQIAMMPPKGTPQHEEGMLEYLEDIIGTNKYIQMIEEVEKKVSNSLYKLLTAIQKLEVTQEERTEKINRVKVVEKEKKNLEVEFSEQVVFTLL